MAFLEATVVFVVVNVVVVVNFVVVDVFCFVLLLLFLWPYLLITLYLVVVNKCYSETRCCSYIFHFICCKNPGIFPKY